MLGAHITRQTRRSRRTKRRDATSGALSPDGTHLAIGQDGGGVEVFDLATGERLGEPLQGLGRNVNHLQYSRDGTMLAATARDGTFRIWDTAPRLPLGPRLHFDDTQSRLTALAFTPDGDSLVTGGPQDTAIVWDLDPERLIDRACDLAGRNLTRGEWELYMPEGTPYRKTCPQWPEPPDG